jgi:capsular polysaccharide transport system permease protein
MRAAVNSSMGGAWDVQRRVIGALIMREIHTRFGRENIGYLWFFVEPSLLALGVTAIRFMERVHYSGGINATQFAISGYVPYMMFRSNFNRASATILPNRGLLYHRQVTIADLVISRTLLEFIATTTVLFALLIIYKAVGLGGGFTQPIIIVAGMALMWWYTASASMIITAANEVFPIVERFIHPLTYLSIPISGMVFLNGWLPAGVRKYVLLFPLPHITEFIRSGIFDHFTSAYINLPYVIVISAVQTALGYLALGLVRRRVQL